MYSKEQGHQTRNEINRIRAVVGIDVQRKVGESGVVATGEVATRLGGNKEADSGSKDRLNVLRTFELMDAMEGGTGSVY